MKVLTCESFLTPSVSHRENYKNIYVETGTKKRQTCSWQYPTLVQTADRQKCAHKTADTTGYRKLT